jgi:hypothetical protein
MEIPNIMEESFNLQKENLQLIFERTYQAAPLPPNPARIFRDITHKFVQTDKPLKKTPKSTNVLLKSNLGRVGETKNVLRA